VNTLVAIAVGGALGSVLRFLLGAMVQGWTSARFPIGTLSVNVAGSLAIGVLYVWLLERTAAPPAAVGFWMTGLLGGFTTFSAFSLESIGLVEQGAWPRALAYVLLSVVLCLGAAALGLWGARRFV
jgi:CrcB protein